jgi:hypothetical protein
MGIRIEFMSKPAEYSLLLVTGHEPRTGPK